jgi:hypothetical protein
MKPYRDPLLPPSYRDLAPSVARHIPVNRAREAVERLLDRQAASYARIARLDELLTAAERRRRR